MAEEIYIPDEEVPEIHKKVWDYVIYYGARNRDIAQRYCSQLGELGYSGGLYDDLIDPGSLEYNGVHQLGKSSTFQFLVVTLDLQNDSQINLHKCEALRKSLEKRLYCFVPIFEVAKEDLPDTPEYYGLKSVTGRYAAQLKDGKKFSQLFNSSHTRARKTALEKDKREECEQWKEEERIRRLKAVDENKRMREQNLRDLQQEKRLDGMKNIERQLDRENPRGGDTHYHINIHKADQSEIKIGPTFANSDSVDEHMESHIHPKPQRQFTTDGAESTSESSPLESTDVERVSSCEKETSSVEFNIPADPSDTPKRILEPSKDTTLAKEDESVMTYDKQVAATTDGKMKPKNTAVEGKAKPEGVVKGGGGQPFDFHDFLKDDDKENEFSEDNSAKAADKQKDREPQKPENSSTTANCDTKSVSTEVQRASEEEPKVSESYSDVVSDPPWTPIANTSSSENVQELEYNMHNTTTQSNNVPTDEPFTLDSLKSTEIVVNVQRTDFTEGGYIPEFSNLLNSDSIDLQKIRANMPGSQMNWSMSDHTAESPDNHDMGDPSEVCQSFLNTSNAEGGKYEAKATILQPPVSNPGSARICEVTSTPTEHPHQNPLGMVEVENSRIQNRTQTPASVRDAVSSGETERQEPSFLEARINYTVQHPEDNTVSQRDEASSQQVAVTVYDSSECQPITSEGQQHSTLGLQQSRQEDEVRNSQFLRQQHNQPSTFQAGDSGIEMNEITGAQGLTISGGQQLSANFLSQSNQAPSAERGASVIHNTPADSSVSSSGIFNNSQDIPSILDEGLYQEHLGKDDSVAHTFQDDFLSGGSQHEMGDIKDVNLKEQGTSFPPDILTGNPESILSKSVVNSDVIAWKDHDNKAAGAISSVEKKSGAMTDNTEQVQTKGLKERDEMSAQGHGTQSTKGISGVEKKSKTVPDITEHVTSKGLVSCDSKAAQGDGNRSEEGISTVQKKTEAVPDTTQHIQAKGLVSSDVMASQVYGSEAEGGISSLEEVSDDMDELRQKGTWL